MAAEDSPSEPEILELSARILASCALAGLDLDDARDVAQDIWTWLLLKGRTKQAFLVPWLDAVARNFARRLWRRRARDRQLWQALRRQQIEVVDLAASLELRRSLAEVRQGMRRRDVALVGMMTDDELSFAEAANAVRLAPGSRSRTRHRLKKAMGALLT
jgi:hypothetical protein